MFNSVESFSSDKLGEIRELIDHIESIEPQAPIIIPRYVNSLKGLIFVQLYGAIEDVLVETIKATVDYINSQNLKLYDIKYSIWSLIMKPQFDSLMKATSKKWDKRWELTNNIESNIDCVIENTCIPTDGKNFGCKQLESVWKTFSINEEIVYSPCFKGRLSEIIGHRNKIAHGEKAASSVGRLVTSSDLRLRHQEVSRFCSYVISVFDNYLTNRLYLNTTN